jgi:hypothetical protein
MRQVFYLGALTRRRRCCSEQLQSDLVRLADAPGDRPSLGMSGEVRLPPERRHEFLNSLRAAIEGVLTQYGGADGAPFRIAVACYPGEEGSP